MLNVGTIAATVGTAVAGGAVATATLVGLVNSQTSADGPSPASVEQPSFDYGNITAPSTTVD